MPPSVNKAANDLLQKASTRKTTDNWDADFDCESDTLFRSSVSSASSADSAISSRSALDFADAQSFKATRASHKSTADLLSAFREDDEDDFGINTQKLDNKFSKMKITQHESFLQDLKDLDDESFTMLNSNTTLKPGQLSAIPIPSNVPASALTGGSIRRLGSKKQPATEDWSQEFATPKKQDQQAFFDQSVATIKAKQYKSGLARNNSLIKGTFFDPPSQTPSPTKRKSRPKVQEEDFSEGFDGNAFGCLDAGNLHKFQTQTAPGEEEDIDQIWGEESVGGLTGSSVRELGNTSIFSSSTASNTESEVEGEDFLDGLVLPEETVDFDELLKTHHQQAKERELLEAPSGKYDSIGSNDSAHLSIPEEGSMDFLDGFDLGKGEIIKDAAKTLHRNVKIKGDGAKRSSSPTKYKRVGFGNGLESPGFNRMGNAQPPSTILMEKLRTKKSMPALRGNPMPQSSNEAIKMAEKQRKPMPQILEQPKRGRVVSSGVRSVQSLSNLKENPVPSKPRSRFSKARTGKIIGDGTELDSFGDLPTNPTHEISYTVRPTKYVPPPTISRRSLESYMEKPAKDTLKKKPSKPLKSKSPTRRSKNAAKLGLIQQLGPPVSTVVKGYSGNMHFNVKTYTWEGNNEDLKRFDTNPSSKAKTPGLIAYISTKGIQIVGDMVFDPAKMKWINLHEDPNDDPFAGVDDLDVTIKGGHGVALHFSHNNNNNSANAAAGFYKGSATRNYTDTTTTSTFSIQSSPSKRNATNQSIATQASSTSTTTDDYAAGKEFDITVDMVRRFRHEEGRWEHKVQGWFPPDESYNREYLNEIRTMVMRQG